MILPSLDGVLLNPSTPIVVSNSHSRSIKVTITTMTFTSRPTGQPDSPRDNTAGAEKPRSTAARRRRSRRRANRPQGDSTHKANETAGVAEKRKTPLPGPSALTDKKETTRRRSRKRSTSARKKARRAPNRKPTRRSYPENRMPVRTETSAGGLVISGLAEAVREDGSVDLSRIYAALIGRLDRRGRLLWSMPKGHVENDEDIAATAEREVWEETGIYGEVFAELGVIDYWFVSDGTRIHKTVHHHLLRYVDGQLNDEDPEVTEVSWIPASELIEHFAYADERKLARIAHVALPDHARRELAEGRTTPR